MVIASNGTRIHVTQRGNGELALVFLHYYGGSARTWDAVTDELADRYRIVATDHRGWGYFEAPADGYRIADLAADAEGVIEALGLRRYVLIGQRRTRRGPDGFTRGSGRDDVPRGARGQCRVVSIAQRKLGAWRSRAVRGA
jgi:hypothetical protein